MRHRWLGWPDAEEPTRLQFEAPAGERFVSADAVILALGGASWPQLGSNGAWVPRLMELGVEVSPLQPANCGFDVSTELTPAGWSDFFSQRFAGTALKTVRLSFDDGIEPAFDRVGECMITSTGIEGSLIYAASARIRDAIARNGVARLQLDLLPGRSVEQLLGMLARQGESKSVSNQLRSIGIEGVRAGLLRERWIASELQAKVSKDPQALACDLKAWPLRLTAPRPIAEAISTAGGVRFEALTDRAMLKALPGVYCAGEMIDWEAPTGGYLLNACLASGAFAANGVISTFRASEGLNPAVASPA
jgi:hypothetical protein